MLIWKYYCLLMLHLRPTELFIYYAINLSRFSARNGIKNIAASFKSVAHLKDRWNDLTWQNKRNSWHRARRWLPEWLSCVVLIIYSQIILLFNFDMKELPQGQINELMKNTCCLHLLSNNLVNYARKSQNSLACLVTYES